MPPRAAPALCRMLSLQMSSSVPGPWAAPKQPQEPLQAARSPAQVRECLGCLKLTCSWQATMAVAGTPARCSWSRM